MHDNIKQITHKKYHVIVSDIETMILNNKNIPVLIGFFTYEYGCIFTQLKTKEKNPEDLLYKESLKLLNKITKKGKKNIIYMHNLSQFDSYYILKIIGHLNPKIINRSNKIYKISVRYKNKSIYFLDSLLIIPTSLEKACKIFNEFYMKDTTYIFDFKSYEKIMELEIKEHFIKYFIQDLLCLYELLFNYNKLFVEQFNISVLNMITLPSIALKIFWEKYLDEKYKNIYNDIKWESSNVIIDFLLRKSYKGGLCDIYKPIGNNLYLLDVNSQYPYMMHEYKYALDKGCLLSEDDIKKITDLKTFCQKNYCFIKVIVKTTKDMLIPYLTTTNTSGLIKPLGTWSDWYFCEEISYILDNHKNNYEFEVQSIILFKHTDYIFKNYVSHIYSLKVNSISEDKKTIFKLLLNSLSGRFAMNLESFKIKIDKKDNNIKFIKEIEDQYKDNIEKIKLLEKIDINDEISLLKYIVNTNTEEKNILLKKFKIRVDHSSAITARAKIQINKYIDIAEPENVYYTDTDSIIVNEKGYQKLLDNNKINQNLLGYLKLEYKIKSYYAPSIKTHFELLDNDELKIKLKGLHTKHVDIDKIKEILLNEELQKNDVSIKSTKYISLKKSIKNLTININEVEKTLKFPYTKRVKIYKDNLWIDTKPITLE